MKIIGKMWPAALLLLACACEEMSETGPAPEQPTVLSSIRVAAESGGFAVAGEDGRVYEFGFETGDRIGVYAVLDGELVASNLCYEYSADRDAWSCVTQFDGDFYAEAGYYAYYPYAENPSWTVSVPEAGQSADGPAFFSELVSGWNVAADQSGKDAFRGSCLMTGYTGTLSGNTAELLLTPVTALAAIELPMEYYRFTNEDFSIPDYVVSAPSDVASAGDRKPYAEGEGELLYAFLPEEALSLSLSYTYGGSASEWSGDAGPCEAGDCVSIKIGGGNAVKEHLLQPGDFYLANGRLLPKDADASEVAAADVIGIVYQTDPSRFDPALTELLGDVHAIVVSTREPVRPGVQEGRYTNLFAWYTTSGSALSSRDESVIGFKNIEGYSLEATFKMADADFCGYYYNTLIREKRADDLAAGRYPAFQAALDFGAIAGGPTDVAPANSGWYLPANGEWFDILRNLCGAELALNDTFVGEMTSMVSWCDQGMVISSLNEAMSKVSDDDKDPIEVGQGWWTSSTAGTGASRNISFNDEGYIHSNWQYKDLTYKLRMVLAF